MLELASIITASAALLVSLATFSHLVRQRKNEIRPVVVLIERPLRPAEPDTLGLYLVNMGKAVALDVSVTWERIPPDLAGAAPPQSAIAPGRRMALARGYATSRLHDVQLSVSYRDLDGDEHRMTYTPSASPGGPGAHHHESPREPWARWA